MSNIAIIAALAAANHMSRTNVERARKAEEDRRARIRRNEDKNKRESKDKKTGGR